MEQTNFEFTQDEIEDNIKKLCNWYEKILDKLPEEMSEFFTARVDGYEEHMLNLLDVYKSLPRLIPHKAKRLLDLGCGTGLELDEIYKVYPYMQVTGIDMTQSMLDRLLLKHDDKKLDTVCADYFAYDFGEGKYDIVISCESLHHFKYAKKGKIYKKIYKALKDGGVYLECDYMASSDKHEMLCRAFYDIQRKRFNIADNTFIHIDIPQTVKHQKELIMSADFSRVEVVGREKNTVTLIAYKK